MPEYHRSLQRLIVLAIVLGVGGYDATGVTLVPTEDPPDFESAGGTSGLDLGETSTGSTALKAFDPGAFVQIASADAAAGDEAVGPA